jgi:hypothetical protein
MHCSTTVFFWYFLIFCTHLLYVPYRSRNNNKSPFNMATKKANDSVTSHIIGSYSQVTFVLLAAVGIVAIFPQYSFLSAAPFLVLCLKGFHISVFRGLYVALIWGGYSMLLFSPLSYWGNQYVYLGLYGKIIYYLECCRQ